MPVALSYPGVYVEELPSGVHTITGVATSITAFIGRALRGPTDQPVLLESFADFTRSYGGLWVDATLGYAVQQFFLNGGSQALIVRVHHGATSAHLLLIAGFDLVAASEGLWGSSLVARVDYQTKDPSNTSLFNLFVKDTGSGTLETFRNVSIDPSDPRFVSHVLEQQSQLVRVATAGALTRPGDSPAAAAGVDPYTGAGGAYVTTTAGGDGTDISDTDVTTGANLQTNKQGLWMLEKADLFNLLCIPPPTRDSDWLQITWDTATSYSAGRRAFVIVDSPDAWNTPTAAISGLGTLATPSDSAAVYFPRVLCSDPLKENRLDTFAPCGIVAGVYARTDSQRGIWKAPAGIEASMLGVSGLSLGGDPGTLTDGENGQLNPLGINCLRNFPVIGNVIWGARTLDGADALSSQWKYIPVRRLAYYIEESLFRGTQWVVFEPNDDPLWMQIRLTVGAFMHTLFAQGAFQGSSPKDAYFVKCSSETTTQTDIDNGIVNIVVGFAPLKPAEFVVIQIQQIAPAQS
jgi:phage tail sheath protein FI